MDIRCTMRCPLCCSRDLSTQDLRENASPRCTDHPPKASIQAYLQLCRHPTDIKSHKLSCIQWRNHKSSQYNLDLISLLARKSQNCPLFGFCRYSYFQPCVGASFQADGVHDAVQIDCSASESTKAPLSPTLLSPRSVPISLRHFPDKLLMTY